MSSRTFQPARLGLARKLRGITQADLAGRVDKTAAAISQYEAGTHSPGGDVVDRIALALKCRPEFFFRPLLFDIGAQTYFRSLRRAPKREQHRAESYAYIIGELAHLLDVHVSLPEPRVPDRTLAVADGLDRVESAAERTREVWGVEPGPIANVVRLLEAHGAVVVAVGSFDARLDAFSRWIGSRPVVVLCSDKGVPKRRRFDAAHELGHLVLHRTEREIGPDLERQAHRFAAALLMPAEEIEPWLPRRADQVEIVRRASETWGVSMQALLFRARTLGTMSEASYTRAIRKMSALGWRTDEPVEAGPEEAPVVLSRAVDALMEGGTSLRDIAVDLGLPFGRLCRMVAVPEEREDEPPANILDFAAAG